VKQQVSFVECLRLGGLECLSIPGKILHCKSGGLWARAEEEKQKTKKQMAVNLKITEIMLVKDF